LAAQASLFCLTFQSYVLKDILHIRLQTPETEKEK
jgi:hypothetical protein